MFGISCDFATEQTIHMECDALFFLKKNKKTKQNKKTNKKKKKKKNNNKKQQQQQFVVYKKFACLFDWRLVLRKGSFKEYQTVFKNTTNVHTNVDST